MTNYHLLYDKLLKEISNNPSGLADFINAISYMDQRGNLKKEVNRAYKYITEKYSNVFKQFVIANPLKESLYKDITSNLLSYYELKNKGVNVNYPSLDKIKVSEEDLQNLLDDFTKNPEQTPDEEKELTAKILKYSRENRKLRPIYFPRCDATHQNMTLLFNSKNNKYYILLYVLKPSNNKKYVFTAPDGFFDVKSNSLFLRPKGISNAMLFQIETSERIINEYIKKGKSQEGKLVYDPATDDFYVHISFKFEDKEKIKPLTIMGIDRGINAICAYSVLKGKTVLCKGLIEGKTLKKIYEKEEKKAQIMQQKGKVYRSSVRKKISKHIIHHAVNEIINIAKKYKSQIYVEDLTNIQSRKNKRIKTGFNKLLNKAQFQKFLNVLSYKAKEAGLPSIRTVFPAKTSQTCFACGYSDSKNRPKILENGIKNYSYFKCMKCGYSEDADINASMIIALKGEWSYIPKADKVKYNIEKFENYFEKLK